MIEITFDDLCMYEPKLKELEDRIKIEQLYDNSNIYSIWSQKYKPLLIKLVGFGATNRQLKNTWAYECAYFHLLNILEERLAS